MSDPFALLPPDALQNIAGYLPLRSQQALRLASRNAARNLRMQQRGAVVQLTDHRIGIIADIVVFNFDRSLASYQVFVFADNNLITVFGTQIARVVTDMRALSLARETQVIRGLVRQFQCVGGGSGLLLSALGAVGSAMPDLAWHGADSQSGHNFAHRAKSNSISNTARCLFLDRFVCVPGRGDRRTSALRQQRDGADNYIDCLDLNAATLASWKGKTILDLGCGYSLFYAEVNVMFGANVVPVDLEARDTQGEQEAIRCYIENMFFLRALIEFNQADQCLMQTINVELFMRTFSRIDEIVHYYLTHQPLQMNILTDDLSGLNYEGVISCFMFCYFDADMTRRALANLCRGMRSSGWLRICVGKQGLLSIGAGINHDIIAAVNEIVGPNNIQLAIEQIAHRFCVEIKLNVTGWRYWFS
ncbi:hypothetical protein [Paraburkholderia hiiakae]|uniref:hypothetical protein n=1 Tax=Paraburkholderia hiiakae TaxID=1081782 RepID=UPI00191A22BB|nr:hypothetical protein [Paraburkholderia hiiakae]